jgi:hypothetical protein
MYVRMLPQVLTPGVQNCEEPDLRPQMLRVGGDLLQRFGYCAE